MSIGRRIKIFYFVCMNLLCISNCDFTTEAIQLEKSASTLNNEIFAYNTTDGENNCGSIYSDNNGSCANEETVSVTSEKDKNNNTAVTPVSAYANETTTEASSTTDGNKNLKNTSDVMVNVNVTDFTSTSIPSTEPPITNYSLLTGVHFCDCDMLKNECDINCCCDNDCSSVDKQVFAYCLPIKSSDSLFGTSSVDRHHCYTSRFIYRNNTKLLEPVEHKSPDLFCIAVDNLSPKLMYKEYPLIKSVDHFNKILRRFRNRVYNWTRQQHLLADECHTSLNDSRTDGFKYGSCISIMKNNSSTFKQFSLPVVSSSISPFCSKYRSALYLQDLSTDCLRKSPKDRHECESLMDYLDMRNYIDFRVLTNPHAYNASYSHNDCPEEICIDINVSLNRSNFTLTPTYNATSGECMNVVDKIQYSVYHNGSQGIIRFNADIHLIDIQLKSDTQGNKLFRQSFHIKHHLFVNDTQMSNSTQIKLVRSGTPGYIPGKPVICGKKVTKSDNDVTEEILLRGDQKSWLTMPKSSAVSSGHCDRSKRLNVLFLENIKSECFLKVPMDCDSIRNLTLQTLFGENSINMTDVREPNIYISKYGDPDSKDLNKWVPVLTDIVSTVKRDVFFKCADVFTNIDYKVIYSYTKNIRRPQAAIIGVMMTLSKPKDAVVSDYHYKIFRMRSSVSFVDVTRLDNVITKFAEPPVYEIKLPPDFFYPFLSGSNRVSPSVCSLYLSIYFFTSAYYV